MDTQNREPAFSKSDSWRMFDEISPRYDFLNHLLSFGLDIQWRRRLAKFLPEKDGQRVLDLATGTADVLISLFNNNRRVRSGCGIDLAEKMMTIGRKKIHKAGLASHITLHHGDANQIPFNDQSFDAVTVAFGIRNMENPSRVLGEMHRVLNVGGRGLVLEFSLPDHAVMKAIHFFYLRNIVPFIGAVFAGHYKAYQYLNQTIETFPYGEDFCLLMKQAEFRHIRAFPLLFGVATIYQGDRL